ncbi:MAG TPA: transglutaminase-like domain-containing protein [Abditibacterium sp.]|jgi:hypothetical protein
MILQSRSQNLVDISALPALLKLCDDPSPVVASKVARRLRELGTSVWEEIREREIVLSASQNAALATIFAVHDDEMLREAWQWLSTQGSEHRYLESALLALCDWQTGEGTGTRGRLQLDELATQFGDFERENAGDNPGSEAEALSQFLFDYKGLTGAQPDDYYNPLHSNLVYTLENGHGLPITLACIFILVGRRVGLDIEGCAFPGHFLARDAAGETIFDPFNGGRTLSSLEVAALAKAAPTEMNGAASAREIVARVLRNLSTAYFQNGDKSKSGLMLSLLRLMENE